MTLTSRQSRSPILTKLPSRFEIMSLGDTDIYSKTYEELVRSIRSSAELPIVDSTPANVATSTNGMYQGAASQGIDAFGAV